MEIERDMSLMSVFALPKLIRLPLLTRHCAAEKCFSA